MATGSSSTARAACSSKRAHRWCGAETCGGGFITWLKCAQTVVVTAETEEQRRKREHQRLLFDGVAGLYDATRRGHPADIVGTIVSTAVIGPGATVLEIGCGTGQFTRQLAGRALDMTAIDIGAAMVAAAAARRLAGAAGHGGALPRAIADPAARSLGEIQPPEPPSAGRPAWLAALQETSLFGPAVKATHSRALQLPAQTVMGVERTRATFLSYSQQDQASFTADLGTLLQPATHIDLAQETFLAMAPSTA
jgi:hypothetical protein